MRLFVLLLVSFVLCAVTAFPAETPAETKLRLAVEESTDIIMGNVSSVSIVTNAATNIVLNCKVGVFRPFKGTNNWLGVKVCYDDTVSTTNSLGSRYERIVSPGQNWILYLKGTNTLIRLDPPPRVQTMTAILEKKNAGKDKVGSTPKVP